MQQTRKNTRDDIERVVVQDFARLIALCANQIHAAIEEADVELAALSRSILATATHASALGTSSDAADAARASSRDAFTRLQFADRLNQRLTNVSRNLDQLADTMRSSNAPISTLTRETLLSNARATFTIENERDMFDAVFGKSIDAIAPPDSTGKGRSLNNDPLLFEQEN